MSPRPTTLGSQPFLGETQIVPRTDLHPNPWNVNKQNAFQYAKLLESIDTYGFLDPILARRCVLHGDLEIIGGQHRWLAAGDLLAKHPELDYLPVVIREMDDLVARKISLIDNELHGQADPQALAALLKELMAADPKEMLRGLPYTDDVLKSLVGMRPLPPLPAAPSSTPAGPLPPQQGGAARFVERTYRMPVDVAAVLDEAMQKARAALIEEGKADPVDCEALEVIAAEYLAS